MLAKKLIWIQNKIIMLQLMIKYLKQYYFLMLRKKHI